MGHSYNPSPPFGSKLTGGKADLVHKRAAVLGARQAQVIELLASHLCEADGVRTNGKVSEHRRPLTALGLAAAGLAGDVVGAVAEVVRVSDAVAKLAIILAAALPAAQQIVVKDAAPAREGEMEREEERKEEER